MGQLNPADVTSFSDHLKSSKFVLALIGAGLSASSGLPTFRGAGGLWRNYDATRLATFGAFTRDPRLVWSFYNYRRHMALKAKPNNGHYALAELARKKDGFITLSQNVDGLHVRAKHPEEKLFLLHGSLFDLTCEKSQAKERCDYIEKNNFKDPIAPSFALPPGQEHLDLSHPETTLPPVPEVDDIPKCPKCGQGKIRPGVVWFGEELSSDMIAEIDNFVKNAPTIDLIMVIGTSANVYPAAAYIPKAKSKGARVAVINMSRDDIPNSGMREGLDWMFEGDAAKILPIILKEEIGELNVPTELEE